MGRTRGGLSTKILAIADSNGLPLAVCLGDGQRHDIVFTERAIDASVMEALPPRLIADKAWDSLRLREKLKVDYDIELITPRRKNNRTKVDRRTLRRYRRRWKVERLFSWLKNYRRINTRWENKAENYLGFIHLGCIMLLLKRFVPEIEL